MRILPMLSDMACRRAKYWFGQAGRRMVQPEQPTIARAPTFYVSLSFGVASGNAPTSHY